MQSCPKNGLTGPLTGDSKRSNMTSISKDSMPLPPVALALPLEPNSITGPPSPARGSAGMPPPPSPAGATYQPPPPLTKQESQSPDNPDACKLEKKRKARVGKAMVRNNIAAGMQQNTMLLMCNPQNQHYVSTVKREIESPKEKETVEEKRELCSSDEDTKPVTENLPIPLATIEKVVEPVDPESNVSQEPTVLEDNRSQKESKSTEKESCPISEPMQPVVSTVAENVKVKNMKRKLSLTKESKEVETAPSPAKKQKVGSYKCLIKKETNCIKINNGKRKLIEEHAVPEEINQRRRSITSNKPTTKRRLSATKEEPSKRPKITKTVPQVVESISSVENQKSSDAKTVQRSSVVVLDNLLAKNSIDRTIESVVKETSVRTAASIDVDAKTVSKCVKSNKEPSLSKKSTNNQKTVQAKVKSECKKIEKTRKSKCNEVLAPQVITKVPRRSLHAPKWSNGWRWEGEPYQSKVFINVSLFYVSNQVVIIVYNSCLLTHVIQVILPNPDQAHCV